MTSPQGPSSVRPVDYKGEPLDAERGPGLGCFRFQMILLVALIVLTPLTVVWGWPSEISIVLLFATIVLLLFAGQTVIFLLRLVAADRREGRRVPLAGATPTIGELEDALPPAAEAGTAPRAPVEEGNEPPAALPAEATAEPPTTEGVGQAASGPQPADASMRE